MPSSGLMVALQCAGCELPQVPCCPACIEGGGNVYFCVPTMSWAPDPMAVRVDVTASWSHVNSSCDEDQFCGVPDPITTGGDFIGGCGVIQYAFTTTRCGVPNVDRTLACAGVSFNACPCGCSGEIPPCSPDGPCGVDCDCPDSPPCCTDPNDDTGSTSAQSITLYLTAAPYPYPTAAQTCLTITRNTECVETGVAPLLYAMGPISRQGMINVGCDDPGTDCEGMYISIGGVNGICTFVGRATCQAFAAAITLALSPHITATGSGDWFMGAPELSGECGPCGDNPAAYDVLVDGTDECIIGVTPWESQLNCGITHYNRLTVSLPTPECRLACDVGDPCGCGAVLESEPFYRNYAGYTPNPPTLSMVPGSCGTVSGTVAWA